MHLMVDPNKATQEKLLYEELAQELVTPQRFSIAPVVKLLPETARIYEFPVQPELGK